MFVLATVGTDHHPFDRFIEWIDEWHARHPHIEVFLQRGTTERVPKVASEQWLDRAQLDDMMKRADAIVCHGGPSTIMEARQSGVVPVVIPRDPSKGEHVDGHQMRFAEIMATKQTILLARSAHELETSISAVLDGGVDMAGLGDPSATLDRISDVLDNLMSRPCRPILGAKGSR